MVSSRLTDGFCGFYLCSGLLKDQLRKLGADVNQRIQNAAIALRARYLQIERVVKLCGLIGLNLSDW